MTDEAKRIIQRINDLDAYYDWGRDCWRREPTEAMKREMVNTPDGWRRRPQEAPS